MTSNAEWILVVISVNDPDKGIFERNFHYSELGQL